MFPTLWTRSTLAALTCLATALTPAAALEVVSTNPSQYELGVSPSIPSIDIVFDEDIVVPSTSIRVAGVMSGIEPGTVTVTGNTLSFQPGATFLPGEKVRVHLHRDIEGMTSGTKLTGGYYFSFTVASGFGGIDFSEFSVFDASIIPYFIYGGDVDEDGRPDICVPNEGTSDVSVFLNDSGIGEFDARTDYGVGQKPSSIYGDDFDNDGWQDLATADIQGSTMTVLMNNGDGTFSPAGFYPTDSDDCRQVHGADLDGDLDIDLVATSHVPAAGQGEVWVFYNRGSGTFFPGFPYTGIADGSFTVEVEDYDGDGHPDIAVGCREADLVTILLNDGTGGSFSIRGHYPAGNGPWDTDANDLDGDGDVDLVMADSFGNRMGVLLNDGTGAFTATSVATSAFPLGVHLADLDGNGTIDAITSNFSGANAQVFLNDGTGSFTWHENLLVQLTGSYPWASDLDGDGDMDISVVDENSDLLFVFYNGLTASSGPSENGRALPALLALPNPMRSDTGARILLRGKSRLARLDVVSPAGRLVRSLDGPSQPLGLPYVDWDGLDGTGRRVAPGRYFLRGQTAEGRVLTGEVQVLN
ncbi:MAG: VCBS repeat-containing protein [Candidatus Eisenbacteria bacterium]|nr:VCBS repeat-containing protein [Candidatus Eisenbacteria bacterium]